MSLKLNQYASRFQIGGVGWSPNPQLGAIPQLGDFSLGSSISKKMLGNFTIPQTPIGDPNWGLGEGGFGQKIKKITPNPPIGDPNWGLGKKNKKLKNKNKIKIIIITYNKTIKLFYILSHYNIYISILL